MNPKLFAEFKACKPGAFLKRELELARVGWIVRQVEAEGGNLDDYVGAMADQKGGARAERLREQLAGYEVIRAEKLRRREEKLALGIIQEV
jgi:hypothetical protein